ncbi:Ependymin-2 [Oryzias melastigma]|uniref:Ependymin-2 n=1 Tax=Oryzias melastigma TaxID=30732 RepID=A0A834CEA9_ORYME|nr:Ependymin-2 [Oryzias melastigma]
MKLEVVLACLVVSCLAEKPRPCTSPPLLTGELSMYSQDERIGILGKYLYDALGQRVRLFEMGIYENRSFTADVLLHFREVTRTQTPFSASRSSIFCDSTNLPQEFISIPLFSSDFNHWLRITWMHTIKIY